MGTKITDLLEPEETSIGELAHKKLAVDAYNILYQFLTTIRTRDGTPLKNSKGKVTSHLVGLFNRTTTYLEHNLKLAFVFDGETPDLKEKERQRRKKRKQEAKKKLEKARRKEDVAGMKKYAGRTAVLTSGMVDEAKTLLRALGIPCLDAPAEAEAQCARIVQNGDADLVSTQDMDCLLFGAPKMLRNLSITGRRKKPGTNSYYTIEPEIITLQKELERLEITQEQLVIIGMLVGTDFNPGGIHGIGPKTALKLVREYGENKETIFAEAEWEEHNDASWQAVYEVITEMPTTDEYALSWSGPDPDAVKEFLVDEFELSKERVSGALESLAAAQQQKGLGDYF